MPYTGVHGISALVREEIYDKIVKLDSLFSNCVLWLRLDKDIIGFEFILGVVYIPCESSDFHNDSLFDDLYADIFELNSIYNLQLLLVGDFNSCTRYLNDFVSENCIADFLSPDSFFPDNTDNDKYILESMGILTERFNKDNHINENGKKLIDLCHATNAYILNGRVGVDAGIGNFTCHRVNGESAVDYAIASAEVFPKVSEFFVDTFDKCLSDVHSPLCITLYEKNDTLFSAPDTVADREADCCLDVDMIITRWTPEVCKDYNNAFNENDILHLSGLLNSLSDTVMDQEKMDDFAKKFAESLIAPAKKLGISKIQKNKHAKPIRRYGKKAWFNTDCEIRRKEYLSLKNKLRLAKDPIEKAKYGEECKRKFANYKKFIKNVQRTYNRTLQKRIRDSKSCNPKDYWKLLNGSDKLAKTMGNISLSEFKQHFQSLGRPGDGESSNFDPRIINFSINEEINKPFSVAEVNSIIKKLKNNKACGIDNVINEFIKNSPQGMIDLTVKLFNTVLETGIVPSDWCVGIIMPLYKNKGSVDNPDNYRGITLLSCIGKLFTAALNERLSWYIEGYGIMGEEQAGFREGYSTIDQVFVLSSLIDFYLFGGQRIYCAFVDYKKAFDLVNRSFLWTKLISSGINGNVIRVIFNMYYNAKSCVKKGGAAFRLFCL